ncbi:MAG TPA: amylo-alpha-1,6-glucosidase, partial [Thermoplasmata archaeon]
ESLSVGPSLSALSIPPWREWLQRTPTLAFPDDARLERAYDLARGALRALYTQPDPSTTGLVAGYPWYAALWCRDLAWMLPAVLWMGDPEWTQAAIDTVFHFQARVRVPLLGAEVGELPMQISPGPVFLFGTSDTSLYYPELVRRLVQHTGRTDAARSWWPRLLAIAGWAQRKCDPGSGLFANGGEVSELRDAATTIGSMHFGFDAVDTTIWDSTDRRDHAVDLQVLHHRALSALAEVGRSIGEDADAAGWTSQAERIAAALNSRYGWAQESYLYDSLARDGTPVPHLRPNALRVVSAGLLPPDRARAIVERASRPDLSTPWGVRTLSDRDPGFHPMAYHDGQVWTIATAWAADACFAVGDVARGMGYLHQNADRLIEENGLANECYRGDAYVPFDSCFLLGFSIAPFLSILFERVWGLSVDAVEGVLRVAPQFPEGWRSASLHHLRIGVGFVDLDWADAALEVAWEGPGTLQVVVEGTSARLAPGDRLGLPLPGRQRS